MQPYISLTALKIYYRVSSMYVLQSLRMWNMGSTYILPSKASNCNGATSTGYYARFGNGLEVTCTVYNITVRMCLN
jgi:hypothetical protein